MATTCDRCGDQSNSAPGLPCGRVEDGSEPCRGTYRRHAPRLAELLDSLYGQVAARLDPEDCWVEPQDGTPRCLVAASVSGHEVEFRVRGLLGLVRMEVLRWPRRLDGSRLQVHVCKTVEQAVELATREVRS